MSNEWISIGNRKDSILNKSLDLISWSEELQKIIGKGYIEIITTSFGDYFVKEKERSEISTIIEDSNNGFFFVNKLKTMNFELNVLLQDSNVNFKLIFERLVTFLAYFYIARIDVKLLYGKASVEDKKEIEEFRNDNSLFFIFDKVFNLISKGFSIPLNLLNNFTYYEVISLLNNKNLDKKEILSRKDRVWSLVFRNHKLELFCDDLSPIKRDLDLTEDFVKGDVAFGFGNTIKGIVGKDVLVSIMTTPDMFHEMNDKRAIITDEGGILSHAAIFAREFEIPCIVGTKNASKIFKEGDNVEIDTHQGIVRKIN